MRVYLPATLNVLAAVLAPGSARELPARDGFAVTPGMREWYASGDTQELEYLARTAPAAARVRQLSADPSAVRRRVVIAADVDPAAVSIGDDGTRALRGQVS